MSESELCAANRNLVAALDRLRVVEQSASNGELLEQLKFRRRLRRKLDQATCGSSPIYRPPVGSPSVVSTRL
jgi:hypothetical protein